MSYDLQVLRDHRDALLLAEVAAWLHDMGKCADAFYQPSGTGFNATQCQGKPRVNPHKAAFTANELQKLPYWSKLSPNRGQCARREEASHPTALWRTFQQIGFQPTNLDKPIVLPTIGSDSLRELILWGRPFVSDRYTAFQNILGPVTHFAGLLGWAHSRAHLEKEDAAGDTSTEMISSPFGCELSNERQISNLNDKLVTVLNRLGGTRSKFSSEMERNFNLALGDTRRPINEVTLWDWSSIVAALYKTELARCILTGEKREPRDVVWRLLSIRTDGLDYLFGVSSIPDLLARKDLLTDGWKRVKKLLEETYPLGLEVYRDENGPVFVVPDIKNLDALQDSVSGKTLRQQIFEQFAQGTVRGKPKLAIRGELVSNVYLDPESWKGQPAPHELPPISKNWKDPTRKGHLERDVETVPDPETMANWWDGSDAEVCTVCGLRPQGSSQKAKDRHVCDICEQRRSDRSKEWTTKKLYTTIWIDEVADENGRLALIVGTFDLTHWLSGDLVRTLAVREPNDQNGHTADEVAKNPSFARLRRIWETTRTFWQEVTPANDGSAITTSLVAQSVESAEPRLEIRGELSPRRLRDTLGPSHTYELVLPRGVRLSAVWDEGKQRFITCDNLEYLAREGQLGKPVQDVLRAGATFTVEEPVGYGGSNKEWGTFTLTQDAEDVPNSTYIPAIPILAEPRTFMALVPANKAIEVVQAIKTKYEHEMGKVRNRLPLHLGVVYVGRRTPLASVLDAGRRMLRRASQTVQAEVVAKSDVDNWPEKVTLQLKLGEGTITIGVPTVMGDGSTPDVWYPYWQVAGKPTDRGRWFKGPDEEHWVHVCDLRPGDTVAFSPSTFDFEYLDASARRFEVAYDGDRRRMGDDKKQRPYLLEELDALEGTWRLINRLSISQIKALEALIEAKRRDWGEPTGTVNDVSETFRQFVADALCQADVHTPALETAALTGMLADALEIHLTVHKDKPQQEDA